MNNKISWTQFWDMHSGGGLKEAPYHHIYIQAPQAEAEIIFYNRFGHNPNRVSCTCCGEDYSISEAPTLEQISGYQRNCKWSHKLKTYIEEPRDIGAYQTLEEYKQNKDVLIIPDEDIKPEERKGELPKQGYIWVD